MGLDEERNTLDVAQGSVSDYPRVDPQAPIPNVAATKTPDGVVDHGKYGGFQDAGAKNSVSAGLQ